MPPAPGSALRSWSIACGSAVVGLLVLLAGSDWPPPTGFWRLLVVAVPLATLVAWRVRTWWAAPSEDGWVRWLSRGASEGAVAGVVVAVAFALMGSGEPSAEPGPAQWLLWTVVLGVVGSGYGALIGAVARVTRPGGAGSAGP